MSFENYQSLSSSEKCKKLVEQAKLENVRTSGSEENSDELHEYENLISERTDCTPRVFQKSENDEDKDETTLSSKFLNGKTKIIVSNVPARSAHQATARNQIKPDNQLIEKNNDDIEKKAERKKGALLKKRVIYIMDCFIAAVIVGPMVVAHWRGIWVLMDFHENIFGGWLCFGAGMGLHLLFALLRQPLHRVFASGLGSRGRWSRLVLRLGRTLYTYAFSLACNCHWRGAWILLNDCFGAQPGVITCFTLAILGDLIVLRCMRNLLAPPFLVTLDSPRFVFRFPTRYRANSRDWTLYILDCAFSVGVVGTLVVFVWRGAWVLFDLYLFPENREHSAMGSLMIGYVIVVVTFTLQPLMRYTCSRLTGFARLLAADGFLLVSFIGTVNVWRGIWNVLDLYLLPEDPKLSCWITHLGCFVLLLLLNCSNSVLVRGVYIDAEEEAGKCVVFPCHYLRLFFKVEREKKEARRRNLVVASRDLGSRGDPSDKEAENGALLNASVSPVIQPSRAPESLV